MIPADRLTVKAAEALQEAIVRARRAENPAVEDLHLLSALLDQEAGVVVPVLQKVGVEVPSLRRRLQERLERLPTQSGASPATSRELSRVLDAADAEARSMGDGYVSSEHLLLALASKPASSTRDVLREAGAGPEAIRQAIDEVRGPQDRKSVV